MTRAVSRYSSVRAFVSVSLMTAAPVACGSFAGESGESPPNDSGGFDATAEASAVPDACVGCSDSPAEAADSAPAGPTQVAPLPDAYRMALAPDGLVWVTLHALTGEVVSVDAAGGVTPRLTDLPFPNGIAISGVFAYVAVEGTPSGASILRHPLAGNLGKVSLARSSGVTDIAVSGNAVAWREIGGALPGPRFASIDLIEAEVVGPPVASESSPPGGGFAFAVTKQIWFGVTLPGGGQLRGVDADYAGAVTLTPMLTEAIVDVATDPSWVYVATPSRVMRRANDFIVTTTALGQATAAPAGKNIAALADAGTTLLVATSDGYVFRMPKPGGGLTAVASIPSCAVVDLVATSAGAYVLCGGASGSLWRL